EAAHDVAVQLRAIHALGWAQGVAGDGAGALKTLRAGIRLGERGADPRDVAPLRRLLAIRLAVDGRGRAARREIDAATGLLSGLERARSQVHRVGIHKLAPSADPAVHRQLCADAAKGARVLRRRGDEIWEARLLYNRGIL